MIKVKLVSAKDHEYCGFCNNKDVDLKVIQFGKDTQVSHIVNICPECLKELNKKLKEELKLKSASSNTLLKTTFHTSDELIKFINNNEDVDIISINQVVSNGANDWIWTLFYKIKN